MGLFDKFKKKKKLTPEEEKKLHLHLENEKQRLQNIIDNAENLSSQLHKDRNKNIKEISENNYKANQLENKGLYDEAIEYYKKNVNLKADTSMTYSRLASLYHYKKEFKAEKYVLEKGIEYCVNEYRPEPDIHMMKSLENVTQFLDTGKWKYDCLPIEPVTAHYEIQEAKTLLKSEDKEKGIMMLENIMENGSYNNTVYYTLYQTYKKDKRYDDMIRVCEKAIEVLGFFSNDRKSKWNEYLEKSIKLKEKNKS